jgi:hypothetical protein
MGRHRSNLTHHTVQSMNECNKIDAILECQKRKTGNSGRHPLCHSCTDRDLNCFWNTGVSLSRTADLKEKLHEATRRSHNLKALVVATRHGADQASSMLLERLRLACHVSAKIACAVPEQPIYLQDSNSVVWVARGTVSHAVCVPLASLG